MQFKMALFSTLLTLAAVCHAQTELLQTKNCLSCHSINKQVVGPAYKDVAVKYRDDKDAPERLARKIMQGSSGVWGKIAMPANAQVSADEAKSLAKFVLSQK